MNQDIDNIDLDVLYVVHEEADPLREAGLCLLQPEEPEDPDEGQRGVGPLPDVEPGPGRQPR